MANKIITKHGYVKNISNASLAEGELAVGFDDTKTAAELYVGSAASKVKINLKGEQGERGANATLVVAASNSSLKSQAAADYTCSGSGDQSTINSAIDALPLTGGKIVLLEGMYDISDSINVNKANVTIEGMGASTVLKRMFDGRLIDVTANDVTLKSFMVDGNQSSYSQNTDSAVTCRQDCMRGTLRNLYVSNDPTGILLSYVKYFVVEGCNIADCQTGILCDGAQRNTIISNNIINAADKGIAAWWAGRDNVFAVNTIQSAKIGIYLENTSDTDCNKILGNTIIDTDEIAIQVKTGYNIILGNHILRNSGYTESQQTILIESSAVHNLIVGNYLYNKNYTNNGGDTNTFADNKY